MPAFVETLEHHCDVLHDEVHGGNKGWDECQTNPGHKNFFTVDEFGMEHLPPQQRTMEVMNAVKNRIERTVRIKAYSISENRPKTFPDTPTPYPFNEHRGKYRFPRSGTGYLYDVLGGHSGGPCPCPECVKSNQPEMDYWRFFAVTSSHVVFDKFEAKTAVIEAFFDRDNRDGVKYLYGVNAASSEGRRYLTDQCKVECVTHDRDLGERLIDICKFNTFHPNSDDLISQNNTGILVSHPHGVSKKISIGTMSEHCIDRSLLKGTRVFIPPNDDKHENKQNRDLETDSSRSKDVLPDDPLMSSSQNLEMSEAKKPKITVNDSPRTKDVLPDNSSTSSSQNLEMNEAKNPKITVNDSPCTKDVLPDNSSASSLENLEMSEAKNPKITVNDSPRTKDVLPDNSSASSSQNLEMSEATKPQTTATSGSQCDFHDFLNPTTEKDVFELKVDLKFFLPLNTFVRTGLESILPAGTKYVSSDRTIIVPEEIKVLKVISPYYTNDNSFHKYDMVACPGSSGALVKESSFVMSCWCHFGKNGGSYQSGYYSDF